MNYAEKLENKSLCIFLFHGVIKNNFGSVRNYNNKHISEEKFFSVITSLLNEGVALTMDEVAFHLYNKKTFPDKSFTITFDDGFENNFSIAKPILKSLNIPAIFFLSTNFIDNNTMSWIDRIDYAVDISNGGKIKVPWGEEVFFDDSESKIACLENIRKNIKVDKKINCDDFASSVQKQLNLDKFYIGNSELDLKMNWLQVKELTKDPLFTIGGHTHNHKVLSYLNEKNLKYEVDSSINCIQKNTGIKCKYYSYPEGQEGHFSTREINYLREVGITCCPTAINGVNDCHEDPFYLRRIFVI